jgi:hypothetical protein
VKRKAALFAVVLAIAGVFAAQAAPAYAHQGKSSSTSALDKF